MTQILQFKSPSECGTIEMRKERIEERPIEFWPEISSRYSPARPLSVDPANSFGRVLFEVFLVLAGAGAFAAGASLLASGQGLP
jgi:hypothetical protein